MANSGKAPHVSVSAELPWVGVMIGHCHIENREMWKYENVEMNVDCSKYSFVKFDISLIPQQVAK